MKIQQLFEKDLDRPINGVVKAEQVDNDVVWNELDEYVVTKELNRHLVAFLEAYAVSLDGPTDNMGVWVSGFFGSGKSHFIKILSYLLQKREATDPRTGKAKDAVAFFQDKIDDAVLFGDIQQATSKPTDVILFNIDAKADSKWGREAVLQVFARVFNEHQGFCADHPHIAFMERYLQKQAKLDLFKAEFQKREGSSWEGERHAWHFHEDALRGALAVALGKDEEATKAWFEKSEHDFVLTVEKFAGWVKEYLDEQGPDHRILFFADEVGQFIGNDSHLMLNLQTIAENLGTQCKGRAWVVVTSQEDIDAVLGEFRAAKEQDFSKIQGRFETRLSLSSSNTDEVIGARLLEKTDDAKAALVKVFQEKGDILKNQVSFSGTKKKFTNYTDARGFAAAYPFTPYHFELVQKIFESIRKAGATGVHLAQGERSMLDGFQSAALAIKDREVGALVPLYRFYPAIESFLDTTVKRTIDQATDNPVIKPHPFDVELLRTLFLIRYVDVIKGAVDNLVTLCLDEVDTDRIALRELIEQSLERLESQNLIARSGDVYSFLTSEEQDVGREIKNTEISPTEESTKMAELSFRDVLKDQTKHRFKDNKTDYAFSRYCDGRLFGSKREEDLAVHIVTPLLDNYEAYNSPLCISQSTEKGGLLLIKLDEHPDLLRELRQYLKTDKLVRYKTDDSNPETLKRILRDRADENRERDARLRSIVEEMLEAADHYAAGQTLDVKAKGVAPQLAEGIDYLIRNTFKKMSWLSHPSKDADAAQAETRAVLTSADVQQGEIETGHDAPNAKAFDDTAQFVKLSGGKNHKVVLSELVERYESRPYGWPTYDILLLVARLFVAGEITLEMDGGALAPKDAIEPLTKRALWKQVRVRKRQTTPEAEIKKARDLGKDLFEAMGPAGEQELCTFIEAKVQGWRGELKQIEQLVLGSGYPGGDVVVEGLQLIDALLHRKEPKEFFDVFLGEKNTWLDLAEDRRDVIGFFKNQRSVWDELRRAVDTTYKPNLHALQHREAAKTALVEITAILAAPSPYGMLHKASGLLHTLKDENTALLDEVRPSLVGEVERCIAHVKDALASAETVRGQSPPADLKNESLFALQGLLKTSRSSSEIPTIRDAATRATDAMDDALEKIDAWANPKPIEKQRPIANLTAASFFKGKPYLETLEDVNAFIEALKEELLAKVKEYRVRIK